MMREIGSNFWISKEELEEGYFESVDYSPLKLGFEGSDFTWTSNGRSAIKLVIKDIENRNPQINKTVCIPSFTCHTVYEPFINTGYKVHTYPIDKNLKIKGKDLVDSALNCNANIILIHRYFGFDTLPDGSEAISILRQHGIVIIEDCTQSLYSDFPRLDMDYYVGSIRKWCGVPDGGFAICKSGRLSSKPLNPDFNLGDAKIKASLSKYDYLFHGIGDKESYLQQYREAEEILCNQEMIFDIFPASLHIQKNLNVEVLNNKRRHNFQYLLKGLDGVQGIEPIFKTLPENVVPLYFPILCEDRKLVQSALAKNDIYAPVVWTKQDNCPPVLEDADFIYNHILCIPIDQRYNEDDMMRIVNVLKI